MAARCWAAGSAALGLLQHPEHISQIALAINELKEQAEWYAEQEDSMDLLADPAFDEVGFAQRVCDEDAPGYTTMMSAVLKALCARPRRSGRRNCTPRPIARI